MGCTISFVRRGCAGAKIDHVDEKLGNFENREIDKRLQLEVRVERLEKQRS